MRLEAVAGAFELAGASNIILEEHVSTSYCMFKKGRGRLSSPFVAKRSVRLVVDLVSSAKSRWNSWKQEMFFLFEVFDLLFA